MAHARLTAARAESKATAAASVATHDSSTYYRTAINIQVDDRTTKVNWFPGGSQCITAMCGKDASAALNAQHGGRKSVATILSGFRIGSVA